MCRAKVLDEGKAALAGHLARNLTPSDAHLPAHAFGTQSRGRREDPPVDISRSTKSSATAAVGNVLNIGPLKEKQLKVI